jgi:hypothetical protein
MIQGEFVKRFVVFPKEKETRWFQRYVDQMQDAEESRVKCWAEDRFLQVGGDDRGNLEVRRGGISVLYVQVGPPDGCLDC